MKTLMIILSIFSITQVAHAQWNHEKIPQSVASSFTSMYPEINPRNVDWDWENNVYEANFQKDGKKNEVYFDINGNWVETELKNLSYQELPAGVMDSLAYSRYGNWKVGNINTIITKSARKYEVDVNKGLSHKSLYFDEYGNRTSRENI